jgi:hypothetical protein
MQREQSAEYLEGMANGSRTGRGFVIIQHSRVTSSKRVHLSGLAQHTLVPLDCSYASRATVARPPPLLRESRRLYQRSRASEQVAVHLRERKIEAL